MVKTSPKIYCQCNLMYPDIAQWPQISFREFSSTRKSWLEAVAEVGLVYAVMISSPSHTIPVGSILVESYNVEKED